MKIFTPNKEVQDEKNMARTNRAVWFLYIPTKEGGKMKKIILVSTIFVISMVLIISAQPGQDTKPGNAANLPQPFSKMSVNINYGNLPLYFIPNQGQVHKDAVFYAKTAKYKLWITRQGLVFDSFKMAHKDKTLPANKNEMRPPRHNKDDLRDNKFLRDVSRLIFINANKEPEIVPVDMSQHRVNYFIGKDKSKWKTGIATSKAVLYKKLYKNIDLKVYGIEKQIEYDWVIKPGGNPDHIRFKYNHITSTYIDDSGDLIIETKFGQLIHKKPVSYQVIAGKTVPVETGYKKTGKHEYGLHVIAYNKNYELVIDPVARYYSTIVDGDTDTDGRGIAIDASGRAYVTGYTNNDNFPTQDPIDPDYNGVLDLDAFVFRLSADGSGLEYSTYLGTPNHDRGNAIAVDSSNCAYVAGETEGTTFPTASAYDPSAPAIKNAFVTKLSAAGNSLVYSTYLGSDNLDQAYGIDVDSSGYAYVAGLTLGANFPTTPTAYDTPTAYSHQAFVTKFSPTGTSLSYSTTVGYASDLEIYGLAADNSGNAYVVGYSGSSTFTLKNEYSDFSGAKDIIAFKINTTLSGEASLVYSTYIGGSLADVGNAIAIDSSGNAYITGYTDSSNFPVLNAYQGAANGSRDAFILKLSSSGNYLVYSTYLGGSGNDIGEGIAVDSSGNAYVTGSTTSNNFPTFEAYDNTLEAGDIFVAKLSTGGSNLRYSTFYGGSGNDVGYAIAVDGNGSAYVTGNSKSALFPVDYVIAPGITDNLGVYVLRLDFTVSDPPPTVTITSPNPGDTVDGIVTIEATASDNIGGGISKVDFFVDNTLIGTVTTTPYSYDWDSTTVSNGEHTLRAIATDTISQTDSYAIIVTVNNGITVLSPNGGENFEVGTSREITWTSSPSVGDVKIEYSNDNGVANWTEIIASTTNDGSYSWTVPDDVSNQCLVRISAVSNSAINDTSDATFSIVAAGTQTIRVLSPNGGEILAGGDPYTITWETTGDIVSVALAYSSDNGSNWTTITTMSNTGSYNWTVPAIVSTQCLVRARDAADNDPSDQSDSVFTIGASGGDSITIISPNGGEIFWIGTTQEITWTSTGSVGNVRIQYSTNNGASWKNIVNSTANDGSYFWTVPNDPSTQCLVLIREASDLLPADVSNAVFSIAEKGATISLTSPKGGEAWQVGSKHDITWISGDKVGNYVKLLYSTNNGTTWITITSSTANDGSYTWTVPNTPSTTCKIKIIDASNSSIYNISFGTFAIVSGSPEPVISLNRTHLYYGAMKSSSAKTPTQTITVNNGGYGTLKWQVVIYDLDEDDSDDLAWLQVSNISGTESGVVKVDIQPLGMAVGTYTGAVKFTSINASNSPQLVYVTMNVYASQADANPFGSFDSPINGAAVMSSIPVTGWALDDIGIDKVTIWRNAVTGEGSGEIYIGDAVLVEGPRPDVEQAYPTYPMSYKGGWGYMLLTNALPNGGNGPFTLHAYAKDLAGRQVKLGSKTITCDNAHAVKPFGAIDTPGQGGDATGTNFRNQGWVLTPMPNKIPVNGSTINVWIDGQNIGSPHYNIYRLDIATLFPGYANSNGAMGYFDFDTTNYESGVHTIQWVATDNAGNRDGIGSRYFSIQNAGYNSHSASKTSTSGTIPGGKTHYRFSDLAEIPLERSAPIKMTMGYKKDAESRIIPSDKNGINHITVPQDERIVLDLRQPAGRSYIGYMKVDQQLRPLPPGASIDAKNGILYWQPGPASFGKYQLVFISTDKTGKTYRKEFTIEVVPKFSGK
jgi:hypothetical protein